MFGQLFDRIAAVQQNAGVAVDIGDLGFAAGGRGEAGIVGEDAGLAVELATSMTSGPIVPFMTCRS